MSPGSILVIAAALFATFFMLDYGAFSPWYRSLAGWVIFLYAVSMVVVLGAVIYSFYSTIPDLVVCIAASLLCLSLLGKIVVLHIERHRGHSTRRHVDSHQT